MKPPAFTGPRFWIIQILVLGLGAGLASPSAASTNLIQRITFGSCANQNQPAPIWTAIAAARPDLFIFTGDNIYADTDDRNELIQKYEKLAAIPGYQSLKAICPIRATWDDHDYGLNDGGAEYEFKDQSREVFLNFFQVPTDSPRRQHPGVYDAEIFGPPGRQVQIILLDTRYFRGPLIKGPKQGPDQGPYSPNPDPGVTMLGEEQWKWLDAQFRIPAQVRLLVSSIQVASDQHAWEGWHLLPHQRDRLFKLLDDDKVSGAIIISGDRHHGELSRITTPGGIPLYDLTSSGLNMVHGRREEPNPHRIGKVFWPANFGWIEIDWSSADSLILLALCDAGGKQILQHPVRLSELRPHP